MTPRRSFREIFHDFQAIRGEPPDPVFLADLSYLENRDLDLSVRLGAMLAFNALLITIGTHPVSASPGAPLSLDAATQPLKTIASCIAILPFVVSSGFCLAAVLMGEEPDLPGSGEPSPRRLFAAFVHSIALQKRRLTAAVRCSVAGGVLTVAVWAWVLVDKMR